jgi:hypothetical protein
MAPHPGLGERSLGAALFLTEVFLPAHGHVGVEHHVGVACEERPKPCQDGLHH